MTDATLHTDGARPRIRFERDLPRPPDEVWRALTDPAELRTWFPQHIMAGEWKAGSALEFVARDNLAPQFAGEVLIAEEPRLLSYTWGTDVLTFELIPTDDGGTRLILTDELDADTAARNAAGWELCLEALLGATSSGDWKPRFDRYAAAFEPALGTQSGPPPGYEGGA
jgi:uncharacterized protein YndB with AHSA1/START domain